MRLAQAVLVIVDISGYTDFIVKREVSLLHAEQIISELLEAMIDRAEHPLVLNKLEGDAAFLYREIDGEPRPVVHDVLAQLHVLFEAFAVCLGRIEVARSNCDCSACANVGGLRLKAFVHAGEIAIKQVRQFEELAGEPVILVHRLMKNHVSGREYVLLTDQIVRAWPDARMVGAEHGEIFEGVGELVLRVLAPTELPVRADPPFPG
ncbi:DUF2652 domain-containing protein [Arenimonas oryziterrae]|uniref:Guanylate cyclase domain-containing protein n=1 Tax=Arenimonas oryziterrae DSM 21050 = YC6267 TaxID=1121015 RepID=A0A091AUF0_9GAMM|nr:DUF2652 domain-containing protein [Arenimonas oryziterrae]KFN42857.1 hypothetical protein N789_12055 [Arenimonas oryziterrae DSM 21050 = YC6267]